MKILIVDDSITMRRIIANSLKAAGYEDFVEAGNGMEALERVEGIDLILTDWNMPGMDGLSFVKQIRQNAQTAKIPIIMVTAEGTKDSVLEALKAGVNDYIVKPFTKTIIIEKLSGVLKRQGA
jgi:two-component system chemotaxis response regulator CheY